MNKVDKKLHALLDQVLQEREKIRNISDFELQQKTDRKSVV